MPTYRSITISITSQFDICQLPEYAPPTSTDDPFSTLTTLLNPELSLVTVYLPTYPSSQFWLRYSVAPPYPPKALYYFKLFLNGRCVVSWGCGEDNGYRGKTVFGLYDSSRGWNGEPDVERRIMCFSGCEDPDDVMEVKVYRAKGRQRVRPELQDYRDVMPSKGAEAPKSRLKGVNGISLVKAGCLTQEHPKRFYNFALLDPLDKPFASFRYFPRTWDQLIALGVASPTPSVQSSPQSLPARRATRKSSNITASSAYSNSSSSSSSINTHEEMVISKAKVVTLSPPSHAIFRTRLPRPQSAQYTSPQKSAEPTNFGFKKQVVHRAVTAPSLISLSPPNHSTVTARFASLLHRSRRPSPPKQDCRRRASTPIPTSPTRESSRRDPRPLPPLPVLNSRDGSSESPGTRATRSGSMGLLINAVNSAVKRKARAASEGASEGSRSGQTLALNVYENNDDVATAEVGNADSELPSIAAGGSRVEEKTQEEEEDKIEVLKDTDDEEASVEAQFPSTQRTESEIESDTSSKEAVKERKGFLKFNLLRKKVEAGRSASSTPDSERTFQSRSESPAKTWRSWGRRTSPNTVEEEMDGDKQNDGERLGVPGTN